MSGIEEVKEYIKNHLTPSSALIIGSILLYSIGFFIHNFYLSQYKVANFDLIKGKYIYTGLTYLFIVILTSLVLSINLSFSSDPRSNFKLKNLFLSFIKFEGFLLIAYTVFPGKETGLFDDAGISVLGLFNISGDWMNLLCLSFAFMFGVWITTLMGSKNEWTKEKAHKYDLIVSTIYFIPFTFIFIWGLLFSSLFRHLLGFSIITISPIVGLLFGALDTSKRFPTDESYFFRDKVNPQRRKTERWIFLFVLIFPTIIFSMTIYARYIYGFLPNNFGGAKPITITISLTNYKTIEARLIDETEKEIIVLQDQEKLVSIIGKNNVIRSDIKLKDLKKDSRKVSPSRPDQK